MLISNAYKYLLHRYWGILTSYARANDRQIFGETRDCLDEEMEQWNLELQKEPF